MAAGLTIVHDSNKAGQSTKKFLATVAVAGTFAGTSEGIVHFPTSTGGWRLTRVILAAGVNTTHSTSSPLISATIEKNTDGGTSALTTAPSIADTAGTGRKVIDTNDSNATGLVKAVIDADEADFADSDVAFVTLSEAGASGTDPSDVSVALEFTEIQDFDPLPQ